MKKVKILYSKKNDKIVKQLFEQEIDDNYRLLPRAGDHVIVGGSSYWVASVIFDYDKSCIVVVVTNKKELNKEAK